MLSPLDEMLLHQTPDTFCHAGTSDPRFFDRHWFAVYDENGKNAIQMTMGVYKNMDVVDAGLVVIDDQHQHNLRTSRTLRPDFAMAAGALEISVLEPFERIRIIAHPNDSGVTADLVWTATHPAAEEHPHFVRIRGRVTEDFRRYQQNGRCSGWIRTGDGPRVDISDWWAVHDHSWGIRPGHGVPEPITNAEEREDAVRRGAADDPSSLHAWSRMGPDERFLKQYNFFSTPHLSGFFHLNYRDDEQTYLDGTLFLSGVTDPIGISSCEAAFEIQPGTERFSTSRLTVGLETGDTVELLMTARGHAIVMPGLGYSGGYDDGLGLGVWRGDLVTEHDVWELSGPEKIILADGTVRRPRHRLQPVRVEVSGSGFDGVGTGSTTLVYNGQLPHAVPADGGGSR